MCFRKINKDEGTALATEFESTFYETTAAEEYEYVEGVFHGVIHDIHREKGDRGHFYFQPLFISEGNFHAAHRGKSPRTAPEKKDDKAPTKKNTSSFKLFQKSFKIFN
jgi:hypothetical protein